MLPGCLMHDIGYWCGYSGDYWCRLNTDILLLQYVFAKLHVVKYGRTMAEVMYFGVRIGGTEKLKFKFSWGFGRR